MKVEQAWMNIFHIIIFMHLLIPSRSVIINDNFMQNYKKSRRYITEKYYIVSTLSFSNTMHTMQTKYA